jgi:hypothetical protein
VLGVVWKDDAVAFHVSGPYPTEGASRRISSRHLHHFFSGEVRRKIEKEQKKKCKGFRYD